MKRHIFLTSLALSVPLLLLSGCAGGKDAIVKDMLPSRIENIMENDIIPEGSEGKPTEEYDATAFNPRMFVGSWILQSTEGEAPLLEVPAPCGSGAETVRVKAFPEGMVFHDTVRGKEKEVFRIRFDDYYYLQAEYELEDGSQDFGNTLEFRMLYDTKGKTLAVGFTGEVTDAAYYTEDVDAVDIVETDYGFSWNGYELTLTHEKAKATYVPSTFEGDMKSACEGFSGGNGQQRLSDWHFSPLKLNGDGSGTISTYYDSNVSMQFTFGEDGSFSVTDEYGEEFSYDRYWYSDSCLTLPAGDVKMMYQHDMLSLWSEDEYRYKLLESSTFSEELVLAGKKLGSPLWSPVGDLIRKGYRANVDTENSRIPSGCVSPEFDLAFRTAHISVRAVNPTDVELPLSACIVYAYRFDEDSGSVSRRVRFTVGDDTISCGETTREDLMAYSNIYSAGEDLLAAQTTAIGSLSDYMFSDYSGHVLSGMDGSGTAIFVLMEMEGDMLHAVSCSLSDYANDSLIFNMTNDRLKDLAQGDIKTTAKRRDDIAAALKNTFEGISGTVCDEYGTVYTRWSNVFSYGKAELSDEGKKNIDKIAKAYAGVLSSYENVSGIEIGIYARCDLKEDGQSFTAARAQAVCDYLGSGESAAGREMSGFAKGRLLTAGYGETEFRMGKEPLDFNLNVISFRCFLDPVKGEEGSQEAALIIKEEEGEDTYTYMRQDAGDVGRERAAYAAKYAGSYAEDRYTNETLGMEWRLPEGWHFYNDDELTAYNGKPADELLLRNLPIYIFAAVDEDYDTMIDIRLYPCEGQDYAEAAEEFSESLFRSYEVFCRTEYSDVTAETEDVKIGGTNVKKGTFRFRADEQEFVRRQYYLVYEDAAAVITLSGTEDSDLLDDPGLAG